MDTGTHLAMGIGLFGLAHLDPAVASHPTTAQAVLLGTLLGSQAPDFDGLFRLKGCAAYIRNHRGFSHSFPMIFVWTALIALILTLTHEGASLLPLWMWTLVAVAVHVLIDCFNSYGTQALRPLSHRWIAWDVLNIIDPFILIAHLAGFLLWWLTPIRPGGLFAGIYFLIILYVAWRWWTHRTLVQKIAKKIDRVKRISVIPTIRPALWKLVVEEDGLFRFGEVHWRKIRWKDEIPDTDREHPATVASLKHPDIASFLYFSDYGHVQVQPFGDGYKVRWADVRYYHKKHFPFVAVAYLDRNLTVVDSYVGWSSEQRLEKKIRNSLSVESL
jgi:inner membrane protein